MRLSCIQFPFRVAAKCTTCRCVTYIGWLSRKRLISNLPACRGSILGDPDIQKPSPSLPSSLRIPPASPPPPPPPSPPLPPTTPSPVHSCFQQPPPRSSGPIQLPPLVVTPVVVFSATFSPTLERTEHPLCIAPLVSRIVPPSLPPSLHSSILHLSIRGGSTTEGSRSVDTSVHSTSARSTRNRWSSTAGGRSSILVESSREPDDRGFFSLLGICRFHFRWEATTYAIVRARRKEVTGRQDVDGR